MIFISGFFGLCNPSLISLLVKLELTNYCTTKKYTHEIIKTHNVEYMYA
jgi:hypothetical protein